MGESEPMREQLTHLSDNNSNNKNNNNEKKRREEKKKNAYAFNWH